MPERRTRRQIGAEGLTLRLRLRHVLISQRTLLDVKGVPHQVNAVILSREFSGCSDGFFKRSKRRANRVSKFIFCARIGTVEDCAPALFSDGRMQKLLRKVGGGTKLREVMTSRNGFAGLCQISPAVAAVDARGGPQPRGSALGLASVPPGWRRFPTAWGRGRASRNPCWRDCRATTTPPWRP
jgi:hypothetical protein